MHYFTFAISPLSIDVIISCQAAPFTVPADQLYKTNISTKSNRKNATFSLCGFTGTAFSWKKNDNNKVKTDKFSTEMKIVQQQSVLSGCLLATETRKKKHKRRQHKWLVSSCMKSGAAHPCFSKFSAFYTIGAYCWGVFWKVIEKEFWMHVVSWKIPANVFFFFSCKMPFFSEVKKSKISSTEIRFQSTLQ